MQKSQTQIIFYNFDLNQPDPLDARFRIPTLNDLPVIGKRYAGLIFHVVSENKPYIFLNDLTSPVSLLSLINQNTIFGIASVDYQNLIDNLNTTEPVLGSLVTVFPLGVTFVYNGAWMYHSGDYNVNTEAEFTSIPNTLKKQGILVNVDSVRHIITSTFELSTEVIILTEMPQVFDNNRYFSIGKNLYYSINGVFYKIGDSVKLFENLNIIDGANIIEHNLDSSYICLFFWINNTGNITKINDYSKIDSNKLNIESYTQVTGTLLVSSKH